MIKLLLGAYVSIMGVLITLALNFYWIPRIGYLGYAYATLICYARMMVVSYLVGQKFYPVNYNVKRFILYISSILILWYLHSILISPFYESNIAIYFVINILLMAGFANAVYFIEFKHLLRKNNW